MRAWPQLLVIIGLLALIVAGAGRFTAEENRTDLRAWFFDVGQGDSILLDTPTGQQVLIDGGPDATVLSELARALPFQDKDLDLVVVTHNHSDHLKGLIEVLRHYRVNEVWISGAIHTTDTYRNFLELVKEKSVDVTVVRAGTAAQFGELVGIVLFPFDDQTGQLPDNQHDADIVSYWSYGTQTLLLTGDAEEEHERAMLERNVIRPAAILKVGHHGSRTSSSEAFLQAVQPKVAIIQVGRKNRFGHPVAETLERLTRLQIPILRTDQQGTTRCDITLETFACNSR